MRSALEPAGDGVFHLKDWQCESAQSDLSGSSDQEGTDSTTADPSPGVVNRPTFILATEISCIWRHANRSRRVHVILMAPSFDAVERISGTLANYQDLLSDGRPMIKMSAKDLYSVALEADDRCILFPAHAWTPWYGRLRLEVWIRFT